MKAKILISQKDIKNYRSGVPRLVLSEVRYLASHQYTPIVIAENIQSHQIFASGGKVIKTLRWPFSGYKRRTFYQSQVNKYIKRIKPDIVIGHGDIIEQDICFIHNCVHLAHEKINNNPLPAGSDIGRIHTEILSKKKFKILVCNSQMMKNDLANRFDLSDRKIIVNYPTFDATQFINIEEDMRKALEISKEKIVIGFITSGNFKKRNLKLFLESLIKLPSHLNIEILIAGKDKIGPYQELINELPFKAHILPPIDNVAQYYQTCDVFCLPAHIEEFGMSVLEAMYFEKPVIISHMVGAGELIKNKEFILPDLSPDHLCQKLLTLIENQELRKKIGIENHHIAKKLALQDSNEQFEKLLKTLDNLN